MMPGMGPGPMPMGPGPMMPPPAPSPFAPVSAPPAGGFDADELRALIKEVTSTRKPKPIIPPGWEKPTRPDYGWVMAEANRRWTAGQAWRSLIAVVLGWTRLDLTGGFERDARARLTHADEEWTSTALADERNLLIAKGSSLTPSFSIPLALGDAKGAAQQVEDAAFRLHEERKFRHSSAGNRPLEIDQWQLRIDYGMYVSRTVCYLKDPSYPLDHQLLDPTSVYPVWAGRHGLKDVIVKFSDSLDNVEAAYGTLADEAKADLKSKVGKNLQGDTELEVIEYWNTYDRCVLVNGVPALPWSTHGYYVCPFTIRYSGFGEAMFTRNPDTAVEMFPAGFNDIINGYVRQQDNRFYKATPALFYRLKAHRQFEAVMSRILNAFEKEIDPAYIRFRTNAAAEGKDLEPLDRGSGAVNDAIKGEEDLVPVQMGQMRMADVVLQATTRDQETGSLPRASYGNAVTNQASSTAVDALDALGFDRLTPAIKEAELTEAHETNLALFLIRNQGWTAAHGNGGYKPLLIPNRKPQRGQPQSFPLDADLIDQVGAPVKVEFGRVSPRDWAAIAAGAIPLVQGGFLRKEEVRHHLVVDRDWDRHFAEWAEEDAAFSALTHPKFKEMFGIPMELLSMAKEAQGDPEMVKYYLQFANLWIQMVQQSQQPPPGAGSGGAMPGGPGADGGMTLAPAGPGPTPEGNPNVGGGSPGMPGITPPATTAGVSLPPMMLGPGAAGANVGRPPLPY